MCSVQGEERGRRECVNSEGGGSACVRRDEGGRGWLGKSGDIFGKGSLKSETGERPEKAGERKSGGILFEKCV